MFKKLVVSFYKFEATNFFLIPKNNCYLCGPLEQGTFLIINLIKQIHNGC